MFQRRSHQEQWFGCHDLAHRSLCWSMDCNPPWTPSVSGRCPREEGTRHHRRYWKSWCSFIEKSVGKGWCRESVLSPSRSIECGYAKANTVVPRPVFTRRAPHKLAESGVCASWSFPVWSWVVEREIWRGSVSTFFFQTLGLTGIVAHGRVSFAAVWLISFIPHGSSISTGAWSVLRRFILRVLGTLLTCPAHRHYRPHLGSSSYPPSVSCRGMTPRHLYLKSLSPIRRWSGQEGTVKPNMYVNEC